MKEHIAWLNNYIDKKLDLVHDSEPMELKRIHTFKVYENTCYIIADENWQPDHKRAAMLAALFHDVARFDQYIIYKTFKDAQSFNHGLKGLQILKNEKRFEREDPHVSSLALAAVSLHNRLALPEIMDSDARKICEAVRDADKIDIIRVIDEHLQKKPYCPTIVLGLPDENEGNPHVSEQTLRGQCASYGDLKSVNDFRVLLGAWFFSLNFPASRKLFLENPHVRNIVESLPENKSYAQVRNFLLKTYDEKKRIPD